MDVAEMCSEQPNDLRFLLLGSELHHGVGGDDLSQANRKRNGACSVNTKQSCWFPLPRGAQLMVGTSAFVSVLKVDV